MPKLKTRSSVKKRFNLTSSGKLKATQANSNHYKRNKAKNQLRNLRGTTILKGQEARNIIKHFMPYGVK